MTQVKMTATDTFSATSVQAEPLRPGDKFEVSEAEAKELEKRGLAERAKSAAKAK